MLTVTAEVLARATQTHAQVRSAVCALLSAPGVVLVGHSLECDLHAMRLSLPAGARVLDTALLFPLRCHHHGPPSKAALRHLTVHHLQREIQQPVRDASGVASRIGHSPTEDATAAIDLAALKLSRGHAYGTPDAAWGAAYEPMAATLDRAGWASCALEQAHTLLALHPSLGASGDATRPNATFDATVDDRGLPVPAQHPGAAVYGTATASTTAAVAKRAIPTEARAVACASDAAASAEAIRVLSHAQARSFVWLGLHEALTTTPIEQLVTALPPNCLVVVVGTEGEPAPMAASSVESAHGSKVEGQSSATREDQRQPRALGWATFTVTGMR